MDAKTAPKANDLPAADGTSRPGGTTGDDETAAGDALRGSAAETPIDELIAIMARLRDPDGGCPWDLEQTFATIAPYTIEEAYEVADAIANGTMEDLRDELGDLLLQVVFHARMAEENGAFDFDDVVRGICAKMVRRHPHIFSDAAAATPEAVKARWEAIKAEEKRENQQRVGDRSGDFAQTSLLDDVPLALPALQRAQKLQKRAASVGFDWSDRGHVVAKLHEEIDEVLAAASGGSPSEIEDEIGDLLFVVVNLARHLGVDAETAARRTNDKFMRRFRYIEQMSVKKRKSMEDATLEEMEALWVAAKQQERSGG